MNNQFFFSLRCCTRLFFLWSLCFVQPCYSKREKNQNKKFRNDANNLNSEDTRELRGTASTRIVNGKEVDPRGKYPFAVNNHFCGGSLIAPRVVLSAAHCSGYVKYVNIGRHDTNDKTEVYETFQIVEEIVHPNYNDNTLDYDFMMLRINGKSKYTPVEIDDGSSDLSVGEDLTVMGWGRTTEGGSVSNVLLEAEVDAISDNQCKRKMSGITDRMFCANRVVGGITYDACQGDSGGAIINKADSKLVGVVSWGEGCARPGKPGVYSRVRNQYQWIKSIMDEWNCASAADCVNGSECDTATCEDGLCEYNPDESKSIEVKITVKTDMYPGETQWTVTSADSSKTFFSGGPYSKEKNTYNHVHNFCFGNYLFNIEDEHGDGICCSDGRGFYEVHVDGGKVLFGDGKFEKTESQAFEISSTPAPDWTTITYDMFEGNGGNFKGNMKRTTNSFALSGQSSAAIRKGRVFYKVKHDISKFNTLRISFVYYTKKMKEGNNFILQYYDSDLSTWKSIETWQFNKNFVNDKEYTPTVTLNRISDFPFITDLKIKFVCNTMSKRKVTKKNSGLLLIDDVMVEGQ